VLYQVVWTSAREEEEVADCFVFLCEKLAADGYRRLLRFRPDGSAGFVTWLRVVAKNLCVDWRRKVHGRPRSFKSLQDLSALGLEIYRCRFERGLSEEETLRHLRSNWPDVTQEAVLEMESRIAGKLNPRQQWILSTRQGKKAASFSVDEETEWGALNTVDPAPSLEVTIINEQQRYWLQRSVAALMSEERLLVQLRFEEELSLQEIAQLCGLGDAQRVHRKLLAILEKLRTTMEQMKARKKVQRVRELSQETK
jgi:RNA polymerase sigma factor (sigma-70 family)